MTRRYFVGMLGVLTILSLILPVSLFAHGGSLPRVSDVEAGPFRLFVWAEPVPALEGEINFTVAVTEIPSAPGAQADPVLGAKVQILLERVDGSGRTLSGQATHAEAINKLMYETYMDAPTAGVWRTTVTVTTSRAWAARSSSSTCCPAPAWIGPGPPWAAWVSSP